PRGPPAAVRVAPAGRDTGEYAPSPGIGALRRYGIDPAVPYGAVVGRVTRQKGLPHLLRAARSLQPGAQLVLCAGEPDTPEIAEEVTGLVRELSARRERVVWITQMLPRDELIEILTHATVFVCPSASERS